MPLTYMLNKLSVGYEVKWKNNVRPLFYMAEFKLFSRDKTKLQQEVMIV
jgi:hypothetical protein